MFRQLFILPSLDGERGSPRSAVGPLFRLWSHPKKIHVAHMKGSFFCGMPCKYNARVWLFFLARYHAPSSSSNGSTRTRISSNRPSRNVPTSLPIPTGSFLS